LLRNRRSSANAIAVQIFFGGDLYLVPIEPMVLVEARILGSNDCVLQIERDLAKRYEFVVFAIGSLVKPSLPTALDVHGC
jgi:hypothetical protein